jgi:hypothetical protein
MPLGVRVEDALGTGNMAAITDRCELVVGPRKPSKFYTASAVVNNTAVNIVPPITGKVFIITAIVLSGDRSIATNGAVTDVYEAESDTSGTVVTQIIQDEIGKQSRLVLSGLHIEVTTGKWINIKADDVIVRANIAGYYV